MDIKRKVASLQIKATDDETGSFTGYGSIFGNMDSYNDVVVSGAFADSLASTSPKEIKLLWQHDPHEPIGYYEEIKEDASGLFVKGRLLINEVSRAREAYALLKSGAISGLSIGYSVNPNGIRHEQGTNYLTSLKLWEISIVTFPANTQAHVADVKNIDGIKTIRDFEKFLRDVGFSQQKAKAIAADGYKAICQRDVDGDAELLSAILNLTQTIKEVSK